MTKLPEITPKHTHDSERAIALMNAIENCLHSENKIPQKWTDELYDILDLFEETEEDMDNLSSKGVFTCVHPEHGSLSA